MRRAAVGILGLVSIAGCTVTEKQYQSDYCDAMRGYREAPFWVCRVGLVLV